MGNVYLRACLKLCNIHLMGKFEKNSTGLVLVKLSLKMFNSCLGHIPLKSGDRLDKLMVLFVIRRMGERRCRQSWRGQCSGIHITWGPWLPAVGARLGANSPCLHPAAWRPFPLSPSQMVPLTDELWTEGTDTLRGDWG